jgi:hypothetical protein
MGGNMKKIILLVLLTPLILLANSNKLVIINSETLKSPFLHQAIYNILKTKKIDCEGLITSENGIIIINPSDPNISITETEIKQELNKVAEEITIKTEINEKINKVKAKK